MVTVPVDRIVVIEALEHFGFSRHDDFFKFPTAMPDDGVMLLHSITIASFGAQHRRIGFTRACASAVERPYARPEANRGAVAPEPKESS
jgi:cyclopropane fatty-acyl-phospholipid synthase-like methyltransferase